MPKRKAAAGDGSIYQAGGRWVGTLSLPPEGGRRRRKYVYGATQRDVREALTRARADLLDGRPVRSNERETVETFLGRWLEAVRPSLRPRTWTMYELHVRRHLVPHIGTVRLTALTTDRIQIALNRLGESGLSPRSVRHIRATLRLALNAGIEWGLISRNTAARGVKLLPLTKHEVTVLSEDEARRLLDAARNDRLFGLWTAALAMGLRQGEALGLSWADVDIDRGVLHVRHSLQRIGGSLVLTATKTEGSAATMRMPEVVAAAMKAHRARQELDRRMAGDAWHETGLCFTTSIGTAIDARNLQRQFHSLLREAGVRRIRFHDLRHSFASILLARGATFHEVAQLLRHSSPALVASTYGHVLPQRSQEVIGEMDAVLGGAR